jgi:hypothetical protein
MSDPSKQVVNGKKMHTVNKGSANCQCSMEWSRLCYSSLDSCNTTPMEVTSSTWVIRDFDSKFWEICKNWYDHLDTDSLMRFFLFSLQNHSRVVNFLYCDHLSQKECLTLPPIIISDLYCVYTDVAT